VGSGGCQAISLLLPADVVLLIAPNPPIYDPRCLLLDTPLFLSFSFMSLPYPVFGLTQQAALSQAPLGPRCHHDFDPTR
jgi:hypothetical protein